VISQVTQNVDLYPTFTKLAGPPGHARRRTEPRPTAAPREGDAAQAPWTGSQGRSGVRRPALRSCSSAGAHRRRHSSADP
jgi:hypothetical protein